MCLPHWAVRILGSPGTLRECHGWFPALGRFSATLSTSSVPVQRRCPEPQGCDAVPSHQLRAEPGPESPPVSPQIPTGSHWAPRSQRRKASPVGGKRLARKWRSPRVNSGPPLSPVGLFSLGWRPPRASQGLVRAVPGQIKCPESRSLRNPASSGP